MILHFGINDGSRDARIVIIKISEFRIPLNRQNPGENRGAVHLAWPAIP
jgi:hypothetical protein